MSNVGAIGQRETSGDFVNYTPSNTYSVTAGPILISQGWRGGVLVTWAPLVGKGNAFMIERATGNFVSGILKEPSEDYRVGANWASVINYTSRQVKQLNPGYPPGATNTVAMMTGNFLAKIRVFETVSLVGGVRTGPPLVYQTLDKLYCSENGLVTGDSVAELIAAGITDPYEVGVVVNPPSDYNDYCLEVDFRIA
jgi:hypothetical protein